MTLQRFTEHRDTVIWEPSDDQPVPVQVEYLGRRSIIHTDTVRVVRIRYSGSRETSTEVVDVIFTTVTQKGPRTGRYGQWAWHSQDPPGTRRILGEITDMQVWSLLAAEAAEAIR